MIFHRLGLINKNQRGFTLVEMIIAVAIAGIIVGAITMTIFQVFSGNARTSNHMTAVRQVQNAGYWISHDTQMAQEDPVIDDDPATPAVEEFLTLTWTEYVSGDVHTVIYTLEEMSGSALKNFKRQYLIHDADGNEIGNEMAFVAQYIDPAPEMTNCDFVDTNGDGIDDKLILTVTATVGGWQPASETRTYEVMPRPST